MPRALSLPKSTMVRKEDAQPDWFVVDASSRIVGRFATQLATVLMGKHKPCYTPHVDCGDCVIVVNAHLIRFSGAGITHESHPEFTTKMMRKTYEHYTGYPSGRKVYTAASVWERHPERILSEAVRRMLPKNKLGRKMLDKLKLYNGPDHPHQAQLPQEWPDYLGK